MMHIGRSSGVEYVRQLRRLSAKSVASYALVFRPHVLDIGHQELYLWINTMEQTAIIRVAGNIERGMVERR